MSEVTDKQVILTWDDFLNPSSDPILHSEGLVALTVIKVKFVISKITKISCIRLTLENGEFCNCFPTNKTGELLPGLVKLVKQLEVRSGIRFPIGFICWNEEALQKWFEAIIERKVPIIFRRKVMEHCKKKFNVYTFAV